MALYVQLINKFFFYTLLGVVFIGFLNQGVLFAAP